MSEQNNQNQKNNEDFLNNSLKERTEEFRSERSITFILTENCQLRCKYCYICGKNTFKVLTFETAKKCIDQILNMPETRKQNGVVWDFIGGEPFMEIELMDKICDYIKEQMYTLNHPWFNNYRFSMSSNGLMYDDPRVQEYIKKNRTHLSIGISVDGTKEKHDMQRVYVDGRGCYDDVVRNVPLWQEQFDSSTKATIGHDDLPLVKDSVLHLWNLGIHEVNMNVIFENAWKEGDDDIFESQLVQLADEILEKKLYIENTTSLYERSIGFSLDEEGKNQNWCGAGNPMLACDTEGTYHGCMRFAQYSLENKTQRPIGNCRDGIDENKLRPFRTLTLRAQSTQECIDCEVATGCAWCQGHNYDSADTDTIFQRATYICPMHKARVRANNYYWNKMDKIVPNTDEFDRRKYGLQRRKGLQYLFVQLDSDAPSICYYNDEKTVEGESKRMSLETLKKLVYYGLTENLAFHFLSNGKPLEEEYVEALKFSDYLVYKPYKTKNDTEKTVDIFVFETDTWNDEKPTGKTLIVRLESQNLPKLPEWLKTHGDKIGRVSLFIKDIETMSQADLEAYKASLDEIVAWLPEFVEGNALELSFLTDRLILNEPNHCEAGVKNLTLSLDGRFYLCPGFMYDAPEKNALTDLDTVLKTHEIPIKNKQLLKLDHAPICENCDAYQCRRCVWLNKKTTLEVNTPSRQQCVMAHLERNASRDLIEPLYVGDLVQIAEIDYLDPFDELMKKKQPKGEKVDEC